MLLEAESEEHVTNVKKDPTRSPEFEFCTSFPQPDLLTADELFSDGVLLPLHSLNPKPENEESGSGRAGSDDPALPKGKAEQVEFSGSKRWRDIFKKKSESEKVIEKTKEKRNLLLLQSSNNNRATAAELNINIWPFSRSRSAGGPRPRQPAVTRKVNSAPCSRSNSAGESKSRKWPASPGRVGVHLGRASPVWQVRRETHRKVKPEPESRRKVTSAVSGENRARGLRLSAPMCMGYRQNSVCRRDESGAGEETRGGNLFSIRSIFTKKVH